MCITKQHLLYEPIPQVTLCSSRGNSVRKTLYCRVNIMTMETWFEIKIISTNKPTERVLVAHNIDDALEMYNAVEDKDLNR